MKSTGYKQTCREQLSIFQTYPRRSFQTTIHTGGTEASHQWTQEVFLRILHSFSQDHQLLKLSVLTYSYHILPLRKSLSRLSIVNGQHSMHVNPKRTRWFLGVWDLVRLGRRRVSLLKNNLFRSPSVVGRPQLEKQTKESVRRYVIYCIGQKHLLLGASLSTICFYCVALGHMFLLCGARPYVFIGGCYESYHMFSLTMEPSTCHVIKYYKYGFTWKLSDYICRLCICPYMYAFC